MADLAGAAGARRTASPTFEAIYAERHTDLVRYATVLVGDRALGEDLAQEAFVRCFSRRRPVDEPWPYLRAIVTNLARDGFRRNEVARRRAPLLRPIVSETAPAPEERTTMLAAIYRLPVRQRAAVVLRFYNDCSEHEIARVLGCRPGTVKSLLSRALTTLRTEIQR